MWNYPVKYDVIVVGGGHAGVEAALASAKMGVKTLLLTQNLDTIAKMSCNPAIGGIGKGHIVREIDALGGRMAKTTDRSAIQLRMLNHTKGPAVWAPRAQCDKVFYQFAMKKTLEQTPNLSLMQGTVEDLIVKNGKIQGVATLENVQYESEAVIITSGTFMRGLIHIGQENFSGGRAGDKSAEGLSLSLSKLGFNLGRLKTGTPPRLNKNSIDFSLTEEQKGQDGIKFSFDADDFTPLPQVSCYITHTTEETKEIVLKNIHKSPLYSGKIKGIGPRYCPSIEDKVVRFADKERHQIFLEPEGINTDEIYVNGLSTSLPLEVQYEFIKSVPALKNAHITRAGYAIEYDWITSGQILPTLETKTIEGLFFAGQINGTTGYEEAAAQGLMAGINAAGKISGLPPFILRRDESYIGVMIDDLITKGVDEPYRMFTSRAEHRLLLRQDNADLRLREYGYRLGLIDQKRYDRFLEKKEIIAKESVRLQKTYTQYLGKNSSIAKLLTRPEISYSTLIQQFPEEIKDYGFETNQQIELNLKYLGYIEREYAAVEKFSHIENVRIPSNLNFSNITGLRNEACQKLSKINPLTLGQASRISGVTPADLTVLMIALTKKRMQNA